MKRLNDKYTIKTKKVETKPGCWNYLNVEIFNGEEKVGEYQRNYSSMYNTFYPFEWNGKEYALYSHDYQTVSLMSLPDCKLIAEDTESIFCPVDFNVPDPDGSNDYWKEEDLNEDAPIRNMAIVAGCVWGDDSGGWKIQAVDMSKISEGKLKVYPMFGYFESNYRGKLDGAVTWWSEMGGRIQLPLMQTFQFEKNNDESGFLSYELEDLKYYTGKRWDNFKLIQTYDRK